MNESTSRRTWLQMLWGTLFGFLALRIPLSRAAPLVDLARNIRKPETVASDAITDEYEYDSRPHGKVTEYTFDFQGRITKIVHVSDLATDGPGIQIYCYN